MPATPALAKRVRALTFGGTAWTAKPTTLYLGLLKAAPGTDGSYVELTGKGYARRAMTANDWHVYNNTLVNKDTVNWPSPATDDWDQATHMALFSAASHGDLLGWSALAQAETITKLGTFSYPARQFSLTLGGAAGMNFAHRVLRWLFLNAAFTNPATLYLGIGTNADASQLYGEPVALAGATSTGYVRGSILNATSKWPSNSDPSKTANASPIANFAAATDDWNQLGNFALLTAPIVTGALYSQGSGSATIVVTAPSAHGLTVAHPYFASQAGTYDRSAYTVTITTDQPHGFSVGERVVCDFAAGTGGTATDGCYRISAATATTLTITDVSTGSITAGTVTLNRAQHVDMFFTGATSVAVSRRYFLANLGDASNASGPGFPGSSTTTKFTLVAEADDTLPGSSLTAVACAYSAADVWVSGPLSSQVTIKTNDNPTSPANALAISIATA